MNYKILLIISMIIQLITTYFFLEKYKLIELFGSEPKNIIAIAYLNDKIKGSVYFYEDLDNDEVTVKLDISGLPPSKKLGFHIHLNY